MTKCKICGAHLHKVGEGRTMRKVCKNGHVQRYHGNEPGQHNVTLTYRVRTRMPRPGIFHRRR